MKPHVILAASLWFAVAMGTVPVARAAATNFQPNPAAGGLWLGEVSLRRVSEVAASPSTPTSAGGQFDFNVLLHVDAVGAVRLLKDVTVMQKRNTAGGTTETVLLTDDALIPNYDGVLKRAGKLVGLRYSSPFYQFAGPSIVLTGGLGMGYGVSGTVTVPGNLPTNPFRHLYHPVHKDPRDLQGVPYEIVRRIEIAFTETRTLPGEGRERLKGTYRETISGLHKTALIAEGDLSLERVSLVKKLNDQ